MSRNAEIMILILIEAVYGRRLGVIHVSYSMAELSVSEISNIQLRTCLIALLKRLKPHSIATTLSLNHSYL